MLFIVLLFVYISCSFTVIYIFVISRVRATVLLQQRTALARAPTACCRTPYAELKQHLMHVYEHPKGCIVASTERLNSTLMGVHCPRKGVPVHSYG